MKTILSILAIVLLSALSGCDRETPLSPSAGETGLSGAGSHTFLLTSANDSRLPSPGLEEKEASAKDRAIAGGAYGGRFDNSPAQPGTDPSLFWNMVTTASGLKAKLPPPLFARAYALVHIAIYDALAAADRRDREDLSSKAIAAGAASAVLIYLFPADSAHIDSAAQTQLIGERRHDLRRILRSWVLGQRVGQLAVIHGQNDRHDAVFPGPMPTGPGIWTGVNPALPMCGAWQTWICSSGSEFQPEPPYAFGSAQDTSDLQAVYEASLNRTAEQITIVHKWADLPPPVIWNSLLNDRIGTGERSALRAARAYAFLNAAMYDAFVSCWETKYIYWTARPFQRIPGLTTVITTPNFPSYTSGHSTISAAAALVLGELFPAESDFFVAQAREAAMSRLWGGIHYPHDNDQGLLVGQHVGRKVVRVMEKDRDRLALISH
jgi:membrane-associated phospholipid phosphatase